MQTHRATNIECRHGVTWTENADTKNHRHRLQTQRTIDIECRHKEPQT